MMQLTRHLLELMKKAGCIRLRYGVESGDPVILKLMNKNINIEMVKRAVKMTKKAGIEVFAYFIIGYANETPQTIRKTINLAKGTKLRFGYVHGGYALSPNSSLYYGFSKKYYRLRLLAAIYARER